MPKPRLYDLTLPLRKGMSNYPGDPPVESGVVTDYGESGYRLTQWRLGSHTGTHVDAPSHFLPDGATVDQLDINLLVGQATVVDVRHRGAKEEITAADLATGLPCERLLLCTGWDSRRGTTEYFTRVPGISQEAADAILSGGVRLLGIDSPNIHSINWGPLHRQLLGAGVIILEGLSGLRQIVGKQVTLMAAPLLLDGADGAPARVYAFA